MEPRPPPETCKYSNRCIYYRPQGYLCSVEGGKFQNKHPAFCYLEMINKDEAPKGLLKRIMEWLK